jgi:hypothetical protein
MLWRREKSLATAWILNPDLPTRSPTLYQLSYPQHYSSNRFNVDRSEALHWTIFMTVQPISHYHNLSLEEIAYIISPMSFSAQGFPESGLQ